MRSGAFVADLLFYGQMYCEFCVPLLQERTELFGCPWRVGRQDNGNRQRRIVRISEKRVSYIKLLITAPSKHSWVLTGNGNSRLLNSWTMRDKIFRWLKIFLFRAAEWRLDVQGNLPAELESRGVSSEKLVPSAFTCYFCQSQFNMLFCFADAFCVVYPQVLEPSILPNYSYRDDAKLVHKAIESYVTKYLRLYYGKHTVTCLYSDDFLRAANAKCLLQTVPDVPVCDYDQP